MKNILYYKYVDMDSQKALEKFQIRHLALCKRLGLNGRVLIASEGINGNLTGENKNIKEYMSVMKKDKLFSDIQFKQGKTDSHNFKKMFVRIRPEIVTWKLNADLKNKAEYIEPKALKKMFDKKEEFVILDIRNKYEYDIGHFKNAVCVEIDKSTELPTVMKELQKYKNKKIVTCCTGGVRCEKASAYLRENGFNDIKQLHGGIIRYGEVVGDDHWQGKCFVFDTRGAIDLDPKKNTKPITQCALCNIPESKLYNCAKVTCDKRFVACDNCIKTLNYCCSKMCRNETKKHPERYCNSN